MMVAIEMVYSPFSLIFWLDYLMLLLWWCGGGSWMVLGYSGGWTIDQLSCLERERERERELENKRVRGGETDG